MAPTASTIATAVKGMYFAARSICSTEDSIGEINIAEQKIVRDAKIKQIADL
jgi:hypothetical protein